MLGGVLPPTSKISTTDMKGARSAIGSTSITNLLVSAGLMRDVRQSRARRSRGLSISAPDVGSCLSSSKDGSKRRATLTGLWQSGWLEANRGDQTMPSRLRRQWVEMTTKDFQLTDMSKVTAILPVAAIEQHGPHLPVEVDTAINRGVLKRAMELLPADAPVTVLPAMPIGKSNEHISYPGTLTLSAETLIRLWTEIGESVAAAGIRKLVILNSHGGQPQIMDIVARDLRVRLKMFVVALSYWGVGKPPRLFPDSEQRHGIHGGSGETSMMLYLRPDLVRDSERRNFVPA